MAKPGEYYNPAPYADELPIIAEDLPPTSRQAPMTLRDWQPSWDALKGYFQTPFNPAPYANEVQGYSEEIPPLGFDVPFYSENVGPVTGPIAPPAGMAAPAQVAAPQGRQVNPGNWVYAYSRMPGEPQIEFPANPPDVGPQPPGINRYDLPSGVKAYHVSEDYRQRQFELNKEIEAAKAARDQAAENARMLDQMMRVSKSTKDIESAYRQMNVMQAMQRIGRGEAPEKVLASMPGMFGTGQGYASAVNAVKPIAPPTFGKTPGGAEYVQDARGIRFPPGTGQGPTYKLGDRIPVPGPNGEHLGDVIATGPKTGHFEKAEGISLTPAQQVQVQRARITAINAQLANAYTIKDSKERDKFIADKSAELNDISKTLTEMPKPKIAPPAGMGGGTNAVTRRAVRNPTTGKWELK